VKSVKYDYLIVGAGLFGAAFAQTVAEHGKTCLVIDRRPHIAGNAYTEDIHGIAVHKYGAHIFHTDNKDVWDYVNRFCEFNNFINCPIARYNNELYNLPFNMNTFSKMWNIFTPAEAKAIIEKQRADAGIIEPKNLEEQALFLAGRDIYEKLIKEYTEKQWGTDCRNLPAFIIQRVPLRFTYNNNYFNDRYQGIPLGGYTALVQKLLDGVDVRLNVSYSDFIKQNLNIARKTVYTGPIDEFFPIVMGNLNTVPCGLKRRYWMLAIIRATPLLIIRNAVFRTPALSNTSILILARAARIKPLSQGNILPVGNGVLSPTTPLTIAAITRFTGGTVSCRRAGRTSSLGGGWENTNITIWTKS
jgi:UDP-galactopyranose mutase